MLLGTRSAASPCSSNSRSLPSVRRLGLLLATVAFVPGALLAQLTTGAIEGTLRDYGWPSPGRRADSRHRRGRFPHRHSLELERRIRHDAALRTIPAVLEVQHGAASSSATIFVAPLQTVRFDLVIDASGSIRGVATAIAGRSGIWTDATSGRLYPEAFSLQGLLLSREPSSVTEPLDFTGLSDNRLAVESQRGFSWTDTQYKFQGMDATDSYQPGLPAILPDVQALDEVVVRSAFAQTASSSYGTEVGLFLAEPGRDPGMARFQQRTPAPRFLRRTCRARPAADWCSRPTNFAGSREIVWKSADRSPGGRTFMPREAGNGPRKPSRSPLPEPISAAGCCLGTLGAASGPATRDQFDALYSGSRIDLSDGGVPAGLEALTGNRMAPSFVLPGGFPGEPETDHLDFLQVGWTHLLPAASGLGVIEVRYGYSVAHLDTSTVPSGQSRIELLGGTVSGAPPLANLAVRTRQGIEAAWQPAVLRALGTRHQIVAGGGWKTSEPRNRFTTPSDMNLITANGAPAFVMEFNTPLDSRELVRSFSGYVADHVSLTPSLSLDLGAFADFSRGSLPAQSSPAGPFRARANIRRATGSDRLEQPVAARRFRVASSSFARPGSSRHVLSLVRATGGEVSRLRKSQQPRRERISMDRVQFQRPVSTQRTRQSAVALRRTLLVNLAVAPPALLG